MRKFSHLDHQLISLMRRASIPMARLAVFVIFFWFGLLKVLNLSPANPLVATLLEKTLPFLTFEQFILFFGIFEVLIGLLFIFPRAERVAIILFFLHMGTTTMPLILLPEVSWQSFLVPTLEGQYIIKNLALIALVLVLGGELSPRKERRG